MLLMSPVAMSEREPMKGTPSSTMSGSLEADRDRSPRIRISRLEPGREEVWDICTPATRPFRERVKSPAATSRRLSPPIEAMEPVTSVLRAVP